MTTNTSECVPTRTDQPPQSRCLSAAIETTVGPVVFSSFKEPKITKTTTTTTTTTTTNSTTITTADSLTRLANHSTKNHHSSTSSGRGSSAGWTRCPLCGPYSHKVHAQGRGIAAHLHAIHTPWKPNNKLAQKIHRRNWERTQRQQESQQRRQEQQQQQRRQGTSSTSMTPVQGSTSFSSSSSRPTKRQRTTQTTNTTTTLATTTNNDTPTTTPSFTKLVPWEPTLQEVQDWNAKVLQILADLETQQPPPQLHKTPVDRNGQPVTSYSNSLPPLLQAAAKGDLSTLQSLLCETTTTTTTTTQSSCLLQTQDRHGSTAEHWAAGGGHLECLKYILQTSRQSPPLPLNKSSSTTQPPKQRRQRRRDGKTPLHYAARNGHIDCIRYLVQEQKYYSVDERSGEGTTPLHMACYGGHYDTIRYLIDELGANPHATNDWGCGVAHWIAQSLVSSTSTLKSSSSSSSSSQEDNIITTICQYLHTHHNVSFVQIQSQGHSPLHKAAQKQNRTMIEWMASPKAGLSSHEKWWISQPDPGGHCPSAIWKSVGGNVEFGEWMEQEMQW